MKKFEKYFLNSLSLFLCLNTSFGYKKCIALSGCFTALLQMRLICIPDEILEKIAEFLDAPSALSFIQVNRHVNKTFKKSARFWMGVAKYIGIEAKVDTSADVIKKRFCEWKTGEPLSNL